MNTSAVTVLIVDDDEVLAQVLRRVLGRQGCTVVQAGSVAEGLARARECRPTVGLFDLCLPDGDGVELAERVVEELGPLPLVLMTAYPLRLRDHPELARHFRQVLTKPLNLEELRQTVEAALSDAPIPDKPVPAPAIEEPPRPAAPAHTPTPATAPAHASAAAPAEPALPPRRRRLLIPSLVGAAVLVAGAFFVLPALGVKIGPDLIHLMTAKDEPGDDAAPAVHRLEGDTFTVERSVLEGLGGPLLYTVGPQAEAAPRKLELTGSLSFDPNTLGRVQSRFAGEVITIGRNEQGDYLGAGRSDTDRPLRYGDRVHGPKYDREGNLVKPGQLLAVVWSKDLGEKKSELVDALSQLALDQESLRYLQDLARGGNTSEAALRQASRNVAADTIAVNKAERTLRIWKLKEEEIEEVKKEARRVIAHKGQRDPRKEQDWARVEVRAPFDGVVVEKNLTVGTMVDSTFDLYKVAKLDHLAVFVNAYEEDIRTLQALRQRRSPEQVPWTVFLSSDPSRTPLPPVPPLTQTTIERIGLVVDPTQHTDLVIGQVDNSKGELRAGQFVTAVVSVDAPDAVVSVPAEALVEDGKDSIVIVRPDPERPVFVRKRVVVTARFPGADNHEQTVAYVKSRLSEQEKKAGLQPLRPGDRVVVVGAVILKAAMDEALAADAARNAQAH